MLPQIAGFNFKKILQNGVFNHITNSWLPQVAGFKLNSPVCSFPTYFFTANWGILEVDVFLKLS